MRRTMETGENSERSRVSARGWRMGLPGLACLAAVSVTAAAQSYVVFNAPGVSATTTNPGIVPLSINSDEVIAWNWSDANAGHRGFVRASDSTITSFNGPNAGTNAGQGTFPRSINAAGVIAGNCHCKGDHGFVRTSRLSLEVVWRLSAGWPLFRTNLRRLRSAQPGEKEWATTGEAAVRTPFDASI
jgi:hypothetical protein